MGGKGIVAIRQTRRGSHALLQAVIEAAIDAVFVKDRKGRYLMINSAGARFLGKSVEEVLGKRDTELFTPETAMTIIEDDRRIMATGQTETFERAGTTAGVTRTFLDTKAPYCDERGNIIGVIGFARDITESKVLQAERDRLMNRLPLNTDRLPLAYVFMDPQTRVLDWNTAAEQIFGYSKQEAIGQNCVDLLVPALASDHVREVVRRIWSGDMHAHSVNENRTKDGRLIICQWFNTPLLGDDGELTGIISLAQDITDQKRTNEALARDALLLANVHDAVVVTDLDGVINYWNQGATRLFGWRAEEVLGRPIAERVPEEARARIEATNQAVREGEDISGEWEDYRKDGSRIWIDARITRITDPGGKPIGLMRLARDVTDRKRAEQALREYSERLQSLSHRLLNIQESERRSLARELHDEIGQNLTGLKLLLEPSRSSAGDELKAGLERAREIVDELLSRVRGLSFDLRPAALDQLGLVPALLTLVERYTEQTGVRVQFKHKLMDTRFPTEVETAAYRIVQEALTNVARHALVHDTIVRLWISECALVVQVEDSGKGFDRDLVLTTSRSGGLAGMHERVDLLGGRLNIESRPWSGTQITAELPLSRQMRKEQR